MTNGLVHAPRNRGIAFLGNYLPRACGIATFTYDLAEAVAAQSGEEQPVIIAALNDIPEGYAYPNRVKFEIRQESSVDYAKAADFLNFSNIDVVSLQHEYGIFGGDTGSNVLTFLRRLKRPVVTTCHTVLEKPKPMERDILREIAELSSKLVVMSERAFDFLQNSYDIPKDKIAYIPHGIHSVPFIDPNFFKDKFGVEGQKVLLTFGLLNRAKGIEYMIEALPKIIEKHPQTTYVVLGVTHPALVRKEGESYRLSLQRRVRALGLEGHVLFYPRFVELEELLEYLGASDIFVTPYLFMEQITSGALSYAMGTGKAVVSTPYWHAEELLADGRGTIVPVQNSDALSEAINDLLDDEIKLSAMRKKAYLHCQSMAWPNVARSYLHLFDEACSKTPASMQTIALPRSPMSAINLPVPKLDHIIRLSDSTGPCTHARHAIPDWTHGYSLEITATTLIAVCKFYEIHKNDEAQRLCEIYTTLIQTLIGNGDAEAVAARLDYARNKKGSAGEVAIGKTIWALGYLIGKGPSHLSNISSELLHQILPVHKMDSPRAAGYAILGAANYLERFPGAAAFKRFLKEQLPVVETLVKQENWEDRWEGADWPVAAQVFCVAESILGTEPNAQQSTALIETLRNITRDGTVFPPSGNNPGAEELPTTAAMYIEALSASYRVRHDSNILQSIRLALDWFLGQNRIGEALYNFSTGGCHDALTSAGINRNQGTESTGYCLLAFLTLNQISWMEE